MVRKIPTLALLALLGTTAACQPAAQQAELEPERTEAQVRSDFESLRSEWQSLANADNAAAVAELYTADAVFVDVTGAVHQGRDAILAYLENSFANASGLTIDQDGIVVRGDMVAARGTFSQTVAGPDGEASMSGMWMTASVYQPDGSVKIRMHLSMLPADLPSM